MYGVDVTFDQLTAWCDRADLWQTLRKKWKKPHVLSNSGEQEWYTPDYLLDAVRQTLGAIDCDPASSDVANQRVGATVYYTAETNGLEQPWLGRVFINPPYQTTLIRAFAQALVRNVQAGRTTEAIWLSNNATETAWFAELGKAASALCLLNTRVRFLTPSGIAGRKPLQGQVVLYFGEDVLGFCDVWQRLGVVTILQRG